MNPARWATEELEDPTTLEQEWMIDNIRYDGKFRQRQLKVGDQVLRYTDGKNFTFGETASGPYKVTRVLKHGSYEIIDHKGYETSYKRQIKSVLPERKGNPNGCNRVK
ncbi:hypothetical protein AYI69_g10250 [Smittium culicis]|uniref:Uncharacterized protein n=1 Tax=Smittium culicis TaxID=133412 RepID=A0A1R1X6Z7_9FUNG|nr:hypothetical protein AYI69_g10250 [Smittium culicis]